MPPALLKCKLVGKFVSYMKELFQKSIVIVIFSFYFE